MNCSIILMLVALIGMVGWAKMEQPFTGRPSEKITVAELVEKLSKPAPELMLFKDLKMASRVFDLLQATKDKKTPKTILGRFSVEDLLALNRWTVSECTEGGLEKRHVACSFFSPRKLIYFFNPIRKAKEDGKSYAETSADEFIKHKLGQYCWHIVEHMEHYCPIKQLRAKISEDDEKQLQALDDEVVVMTAINPISLVAYNRMLRWTLKLALKRMKATEIDRLRRTCSIVVDELGAKQTGETVFSDFLAICRAFKRVQAKMNRSKAVDPKEADSKKNERKDDNEELNEEQ